MQNAGYILAAFSIIWAVLFGYVLVLITREARLRRDIETLKDNLRENKKPSPLEEREPCGTHDTGVV